MQEKMDTSTMARSIRDLKKIGVEVGSKAEQIVDLLSSHTNEGGILERSGLVIEKCNEGSLAAKITDSFGYARLKLEWKIIDDEHVGSLVAEREMLDQYDRSYWVPVWELVIPYENTPYLKSRSRGEKLYLPLFSFSNEIEEAKHIACVELIYSLAQGLKKENSQSS